MATSKKVKESVVTPSPRLSTKKYIIAAGIVVAVLFIGGIGIYFYGQYMKNGSSVLGKQASGDEVGSLVGEIGKLIELPQGEAPTVATVSDVTKLKDQVFFARAQNGDKVLIYSVAKKAILYRPSTKKIVEVGPINIATQSTPAPESISASASGVPTQTVTPTDSPIRIAIYNGTKIAGLASRGEAALSTLPSFKVVVKANSKEDYAKSVVVDISGKKTKSDEIARVFSASVVQLPTGETKPNADVLVILGADFAQ